MESKSNSRNSRRKAKRNVGGRGTPGALVTGGGSISSIAVEPWMPIFPVKITKWLRYSTSISLTATAGAVATYVFRANDLFDPDFTSTGHQPMGFDQLMLWYNHFCVLRSRIRIVVRNAGFTTGTIAIRQDASSTPITVIDRIIEDGGLVYAMIGYKGDSIGVTQLSMEMNIAKLQGLSPSAITADPTLRGDVATSPTELSYFHIQLWDTLAATPVVQVEVVLEQQATFLEPRDVTESLALQVQLAKGRLTGAGTKAWSRVGSKPT